MSNNWTTMYEVLHRYRNAVLEHVASALATQFGSAWFEDEIESLFTAKEWQDIESTITESYSALSMPVPEQFQWLGVPHITNIIEKHGRYLIAGARTLQPQPRKRRVSHAARQCQLVRVGRDPVAHPPRDELPLRDLVFFTQVAQRVLEALGLHESASELEDILADADKPRSFPVEAELPPQSTIVGDFVGRQEELQDFAEWVSLDDEPIRIVAGGGGTGKSALAYQIALEQTRLPATRLNFIIWMTAKRRMLSRRGTIVPIEPDIYDDHDVLLTLWKFFHGEGDPDVSTLLELLKETPGLIIADDIDSLSAAGGARAKALLTRDIPYRSRTKVLATARSQPFSFENVTTTLTGFSQTETARFLQARLQRQGMDVTFTPRPNRQDQAGHRRNSPLY